jgi:adenosylmethionine-8-amino-7-oxononanoate aminotransferase
MAYHLEALASNSRVQNPRILGGIAAFDLARSDSNYAAAAGLELSSFAQKHGVLIRPLGNVIYFMPPYCISDDEIDAAFEVILRYLE